MYIGVLDNFNNSIHFNGYVSTRRLGSTSANYKASSKSQKQYKHTKNNKQAKQKQYDNIKHYKNSTRAEALNPKEKKHW